MCKIWRVFFLFLYFEIVYETGELIQAVCVCKIAECVHMHTVFGLCSEH